MASSDSALPGRTQQSPLASQRDAATQGTGGRRFGGPMFPLSYKEGLCQWWSAITPAAAEAAVLSFLPFNHPTPAVSTTNPHTESTASPPEFDPYGPRECTSTLVQLSGKNRALNEFSITRTAEPPAKNHLVLIHGYGAGLAFFYRNFDALSRMPGWKLWSLDLLGYGRSSRPSFTIHAKDPEGKISEAEDWFIDALEEWRKERGIEKFTLLGHSLGGYLSFRYSVKYPERVNKLIMASPVGIPEDPFAVKQALPDENEESALQGQDETASRSNPNLPETLNVPPNGMQSSSAPVSPGGSINSLPDERDALATQKPAANTTEAPPRRPYPKWLVYLWEANVSPFSLVRWSGPLGPRLVSGWTSRRFKQLPEDESQALHNYAYSLFRQRGSGEYALAYILAPGAFARRPLIWRVQDLASKVGPGGIPSVWMYGDQDWMDVAGGFAAEEKIRNTPVSMKDGKPEGSYVGGEEWRGDKEGFGGEAKVLIVQNAGHHLYLDGHEEFNRMIVKEMKDVEARETALSGSQV
ncbi:alpha/beta-hydrolase [Wilcoxina mikolae CBS 423.85]|nr:alpha/beta-hydrolase [Wilcoxina mikolae CBS 423.85]